MDSGVDGRDQWISKAGWFVCRIDPKKTENIQQRKLVYEGFHTYEGFKNLEVKVGGNSPEYYTFGRGLYPPISAIRVIIHSAFLQKCRGEYVFARATTKAAGVDVAVDGRDEAVLSLGKFGWATAFMPIDGPIIEFSEARLVLQLDQQVVLLKGTTKIVGDEIKRQCVGLGIAPEWCMIDATGNGAAVFSYLKAVWSEQVQGLDFGAAATANKILEQDTMAANEQYDGVVTEVWFALSRWMEFGYVAIAPSVRQDPLEEELLGRRYKNIGKKIIDGVQHELIRNEKKDDYKLRLGHSPDFADSFTLLGHVVRANAKLMGSMTGARKPVAPRRALRPSEVDTVKWLH